MWFQSINIIDIGELFHGLTSALMSRSTAAAVATAAETVTVRMMVIFWVLGTDDDFVYDGYTALFAYRSFLHLQQRYILSFFRLNFKT